jgi:small subunit ribosomal protein S5
MQPAAPGTGVIAGGPIRAICEAAGITDILTKSNGSSNPHNVSKATFFALKDLLDVEKIARNRGISVQKVFHG